VGIPGTVDFACGPVAQAVSQVDLVADQLVAFGIDDDDISFGQDPTAFPVPTDPVGGKVIAVARHANLAGRRDEIRFVVIDDFVSAEIDEALFGSIANGRFLRSRVARQGHQQGQRRQA